MSRCTRSAAIVERLLDGELLTANERRHLEGCPICTRLAARAPALDAGIARAAGELAGVTRIPVGVLDPPIVEPPVARRRSGGGWRMAAFASAATAAVVITAVGLGMLRAPAAPTPGATDLSPAGIATRLTAQGLRCTEKSLSWSSGAPMVGQVCGAPQLAGVERFATAYMDRSGDTWLEAKAVVRDRDNDAQVRPATRFLLDAIAAVITDPGELAEAQGQVAYQLSDTLHAHDNRIWVGGRLVELEGSWSQGFVIRIGPAEVD